MLSDEYADITAEWVVPDPQKVPEWIVGRLHAVKPEELLGAPFWPRLVSSRNRRVGRSGGRAGVLRPRVTYRAKRLRRDAYCGEHIAT